MALQLAEFYKYASNRENKIYATIQEELALLDQYLKVEKCGLGIRSFFKVRWMKIPDPFMFRRLLQPLLENAIKYGYHAATGKPKFHCRSNTPAPTWSIQKVYDSGRPASMNLYGTASASTASTETEYCTAMIIELQFVNGPKKHVFLQLPLKKVL
ncbi:MAG: hypothetical protein IPJ54_20820 [Saprospiraceae bacterium]|nr:hypothetical protein [Saprospiraceae bacterium]